jgi:NADPH:quinone reductase-like Zn-dependent oxidoreductase
VAGVAIGDRVIPHFMPDWLDGPMRPERIAAMRGITLPGSLSEYVAVPAKSVVRLPEHLDFVQSATLPIAATTAWNAVRSASVRPGSTVVILGTGGVSLFALQFAKASGATVILVSSSDAKLERGRALGADHHVNYRAAPDWDRVVLETTNGRGADLVVETVGDATFERSLHAAAMGGTVFTVGFLSGATTSVNLFSIIGKALRVVGNSTGSVADLAEAVRAIEANRIVPVVDRVVGLDETAGAYEVLASGAHIGKIAIAHL